MSNTTSMTRHASIVAEENTVRIRTNGDPCDALIVLVCRSRATHSERIANGRTLGDGPCTTCSAAAGDACLTETEHGLEVESFSLAQDHKGARLVLVIGAHAFEVDAKHGLSYQMAGTLLEAAERVRDRASGPRSRDQHIADLEREIFNADSNAAHARAELRKLIGTAGTIPFDPKTMELRADGAVLAKMPTPANYGGPATFHDPAHYRAWQAEQAERRPEDRKPYEPASKARVQEMADRHGKTVEPVFNAAGDITGYSVGQPVRRREVGESFAERVAARELAALSRPLGLSQEWMMRADYGNKVVENRLVVLGVDMAAPDDRTAFIAVCPNCSAAHDRGYVNGVDSCRCLRCGHSWVAGEEPGIAARLWDAFPPGVRVTFTEPEHNTNVRRVPPWGRDRGELVGFVSSREILTGGVCMLTIRYEAPQYNDEVASGLVKLIAHLSAAEVKRA